MTPDPIAVLGQAAEHFTIGVVLRADDHGLPLVLVHTLRPVPGVRRVARMRS